MAFVYGDWLIDRNLFGVRKCTVSSFTDVFFIITVHGGNAFWVEGAFFTAILQFYYGNNMDKHVAHMNMNILIVTHKHAPADIYRGSTLNTAGYLS